MCVLWSMSHFQILNIAKYPVCVKFLHVLRHIIVVPMDYGQTLHPKCAFAVQEYFPDFETFTKFGSCVIRRHVMWLALLSFQWNMGKKMAISVIAVQEPFQIMILVKYSHVLCLNVVILMDFGQNKSKNVFVVHESFLAFENCTISSSCVKH